MNLNGMWIMHFTAVLSVIFYIIFDFFGSKRIKDEREVLIQMKSYALAHNVTLATLLVFSAAYPFYPHLDSAFVIQGLVLSVLYTEILGKVFYRSKL
jgi:hypothetical protein